MNTPCRRAWAVAAAILCQAAGAQASTPPAPPFDVAYRAWEVVTGMARYNGDPRISGECGRTFRPFVIPGLRMQAKQDQDIAAAACVAAARHACATRTLQRTADLAKRCEEFR